MLNGSCAFDRDFNSRLHTITKPYGFNIVKWELSAIAASFSRVNVEADNVAEYFSTGNQIKTMKSNIEAINTGHSEGDLVSLEAELNEMRQHNLSLERAVEEVLEGKIREALAQQGIHNPINKYLKIKIGFPPVSFSLEDPPHLLVVSPRDKIESVRQIVLRQDITIEEMESIESDVDKSNVSSLVLELGGLASYPSLITNRGDLRFTLNAAIEEWLHQYLVFKPLGFRYMLNLAGIVRNYEIATMNETVAGIVSKEIGDIVYEKYYDRNDAEVENKDSEFDFDREMREIRRAVDEYLSRGEIEAAEEFMEQKRQYLAQNRYHIRKLNQAYFAFHGAYADRPTSISPIGEELKQLRNQSNSLKDFLETVAAMNSRQDLADSVK
ncbi:hypothetical protein ACFLXD_02145 [Chloroflexota bacterium]